MLIPEPQVCAGPLSNVQLQASNEAVLGTFEQRWQGAYTGVAIAKQSESKSTRFSSTVYSLREFSWTTLAHQRN
jgi:hypothetical protein